MAGRLLRRALRRPIYESLVVFLAIDASLSPSPPDSVTASVLDALAEQLINTTFLTRPSQEWLDRLREVLRGQPPDTQQRWVEYVQRRLAGVRCSSSCVTCQAQGSPGLVFAAADEGQCRSCSSDRKTPIELLADARLAAARSRHIAGLGPSDDNRLRMLEDFGPLCDVAEQIDVIDPYGVTDGSKGGASSGLVRFLSMADERGVQRIRILTGVGGSLRRHVLRPAELAGEVQRILRLSVATSAEVHVVVVDETTRKALLHDRFLGFYWGTAGQLSWTLGKGLSQYSGAHPKTHHAVSRLEDGFSSSLAMAIEAKAVLNARVA